MRARSTELTTAKFVRYVGISLLIFVIVLLTAPWFGAVQLAPRVITGENKQTPEYTIFWQIRLPRVLLAGCAGLGLALAGVAFQALLRNPLASPYVLGISAGSSLGAVLAMKIGFAITLLASSVIFVFSFIGAVAAMGIVYFLARSRGGISLLTLLLAGVTLNFFFSALILLIQYLSSPGEAYQMIRWMMGGVDIAGYRPLISVVIPVFAGAGLLLTQAKALNLLTLDDATARQLGVSVEKMQKIIFFTASFITAGIVSVCGPIGFVGLVIPHLVRLLFGADHRILLP
ncbi:MAG: iron ABC transporter permease, partial [Candidatus Sumerlaeia bacterium]|nr:iron ABC transporter permease [Candidatus Sumerlaeia bacterium]